MESSRLNLQQGDDESINAIFRTAHSIKGESCTFGFNEATEFTHLVETLIDEIRASSREFVQPYKELLLGSPDCLRILIEAIRDEDTCNNSRFYLQPNCLN